MSEPCSAPAPPVMASPRSWRSGLRTFSTKANSSSSSRIGLASDFRSTCFIYRGTCLQRSCERSWISLSIRSLTPECLLAKRSKAGVIVLRDCEEGPSRKRPLGPTQMTAPRRGQLQLVALAAVNVEDVAGDERRFVGRDEDNRVGKL